MSARDGAKLSRVADGGGVDEECLLRGRNKTMPFLERCRRLIACVAVAFLRKEKEAEWLLETDSL